MRAAALAEARRRPGYSVVRKAFSQRLVNPARLIAARPSALMLDAASAMAALPARAIGE